jgi:hypothetical protein
MRDLRKITFLAGWTVLGLLCIAQGVRQVKVIIDSANIRSRPEITAEILDVAAKGALLEVIEKAGPWYAIKMGEDERGRAITGYIHESMVEPSGEVTPAPRDRVEPQPVPPPPSALKTSPLPREVENARMKVRPNDKLISGSFLKCGFGDHWMASFGFDFGIGRHFGIGLEFQPYFQNLSENGFSFIQMDVFANLKLGFKIWFVTFYGGGGIGSDLSYSSIETEGESLSQFKAMLATHGIAGVALNIGKIAIVFEYQPRLISNPDLDPDNWGQFFFIGLRF